MFWNDLISTMLFGGEKGTYCICSFSAVKLSPVLASFFLVKKHSEMASLGIFLYRCRSFLFLTSESRKQEVSGCFLFIACFMVLLYLSGFNNLFPMRKKNKRSYWCSVILLYRTIMPNYGISPFEAVSALAFSHCHPLFCMWEMLQCSVWKQVNRKALTESDLPCSYHSSLIGGCFHHCLRIHRKGTRAKPEQKANHLASNEP